MASRERQELSAPIHRAQVIFIVDRLTPRTGREEAALAASRQQVLSSNSPYDDDADVRRRERLDADALMAAWLNVLSFGDHPKVTPYLDDPSGPRETVRQTQRR
jgi:hypothetical protein